MGRSGDCMTAREWFLAGWFYAQERLREAPDDLPDPNTLRRDKAYRQGFKRAVEHYNEAVGSFLAPKGE